MNGRCPKGGKHTWPRPRAHGDGVHDDTPSFQAPPGPGPWYVCSKCGETGYAIRDRVDRTDRLRSQASGLVR